MKVRRAEPPRCYLPYPPRVGMYFVLANLGLNVPLTIPPPCPNCLKPMEGGYLGSSSPLVWTQTTNPALVTTPGAKWLTAGLVSANYLPGWRCPSCQLVLLDGGRPIGLIAGRPST